MTAPRRSTIGWTDYSGGDLNFCLGCTKISPGCERCYGFRWGERFGKDFSTVRVYPEKLERLLKWQPKPPYKRGPGSRPMAFVVDMGDLFHESVPWETIERFFAIAYLRQDIVFQVLSKRSERMRAFMCYEHTPPRVTAQVWKMQPGNENHPELLDCNGYSLVNVLWPLPNLWLGVSVESPDYLWRVRDLINTPAAVRFVSLEPMLEEIDVTPWLAPDYEGMWQQGEWEPISPGDPRHNALDWVIVGAESGPNRRPFRKEWAWDVLDQCRAAQVACFLKQASGLHPGVPLLDREVKECKQWPR